MAMFRRPRKSSPPLRRKQQEIARQEAELHDKLDRLERMVTKGRPIPQNRSPAQAAEQGIRGQQDRKTISGLARARRRTLLRGKPTRAGDLVRCAKNGEKAGSFFSFF